MTELTGQTSLLDLLTTERPTPAHPDFTQRECQCPACGEHYGCRATREMIHGQILHTETTSTGGPVCGAMQLVHRHVIFELTHGPWRRADCYLGRDHPASDYADTLRRFFRLWGTEGRRHVPAYDWLDDHTIRELRTECTSPWGEGDPCMT